MKSRTEFVDEREQRQLAFTLIELLVVVVILGLIAAVVIPSLLSGLEREEVSVAEAVTPATEVIKPKQLPGVPPVIVSADIRVRITAKELRYGSTIHGRYTAKYSGEFVLQATEADQPTRLSVPLPTGAEEAEDVTLSLEGAGYSGPVDLRNVRIGIDGVHWSGQVPLAGHDGLLTVRVAFTAKGAGRVVLRLPEASGIRAVKTVVDLVAMPSLPIPASSLEPKSIAANSAISGFTYTWSYKNLVSHRPIIIDLPAIESPLARVLFLLRLVGLALLLFGGGFWYLAEGYEAGRLAYFRWRHFLLLGLTYSLFFAVFVVCGFQGVSTTTSLAISAVVSLPLLVWHTASIIDWRFAAKYTLPLVGFTIGVVVNGVYGGEWRSYIFVGAAAIVITYLVFTIEGMVAQQDARRQRLEAGLTARLLALEPFVLELAKADVEARLLLHKRKDSKLSEHRDAVDEDREAARRLLDQYSALDKCRLNMVQKKGSDRTADRETIASGLFCMQEALEERLRRLVASRSKLAIMVEAAEAKDEEAKAKKKKRIERESVARVHCIACGHGWSGSRHCPHCGARRPEELACKKCKTFLPLPVHLLDPKGESQLLYCPTCGECHSSSSTDWFTTT